ncbi:hypothetical protein II582_03525 [bacterium]|nr:hypothetical protein [bacterium]
MKKFDSCYKTINLNNLTPTPLLSERGFLMQKNTLSVRRGSPTCRRGEVAFLCYFIVDLDNLDFEVVVAE